MKKIGFSLLVLMISAQSFSFGFKVSFDTSSAVLNYGFKQLEKQFQESGIPIELGSLQDQDGDLIVFQSKDTLNTTIDTRLLKLMPSIKDDGFVIKKIGATGYILGQNENGCLYGLLDYLEQLGVTCDTSRIVEKQLNPAVAFRAVKINLPWSPYRPGPTNDVHLETCMDLKFWESFLDMLAKNRFNAVSFWNNHPFHYMIRSKNFPKASPFSDEELKSWQQFYKTLFKMAKERGLETYLVNWNIVVSPEFAEHYGAKEYFDQSELVKTYTRESVTQLINEYEDLTGFGTTLADWMGNWGDEKMTSKEREDWIKETIVEGIKQADRKVKFIHRAVLAGDPTLMREVIDYADLPDKTIVEVKFNWSHGHSTPQLSLTHSNDDGTIMRGFWDPKPENFFIAYMVRNEDFFVLRWGDPQFIRDHINVNKYDYVQGYFVGSEGYIPAKDYSHISPHPHKTWNYAFEKQWLFYHLWGRLLFNPEESDKTLSLEIERRYPDIKATNFLNASSLASQVPLHIATFFKGTWDFTLYSEGFLMPWEYDTGNDSSPFISLKELINQPTLHKEYLNIKDYCAQLHRNELDTQKIAPPVLARQITDECNRGLIYIEELEKGISNPTLQSELDDLKTWCQLGFYFAEKIKAGFHLENFALSGSNDEKDQALVCAGLALQHWEHVVALTETRYQLMPYVMMDHPENRWPDFKGFHWKNYTEEVKKDVDYIKSFHRDN